MLIDRTSSTNRPTQPIHFNQLADLPYFTDYRGSSPSPLSTVLTVVSVASVSSVLSGVPVYPIHGLCPYRPCYPYYYLCRTHQKFRTPPSFHMRISYLHIIRNPSTNLPKSRTEEQHAAEPRKTQSPIILIPLCHSQRPVRADSTESITESGSKTTSPLDPPSRLT